MSPYRDTRHGTSKRAADSREWRLSHTAGLRLLALLLALGVVPLVVGAVVPALLGGCTAVAALDVLAVVAACSRLRTQEHPARWRRGTCEHCGLPDYLCLSPCAHIARDRSYPCPTCEARADSPCRVLDDRERPLV